MVCILVACLTFSPVLSQKPTLLDALALFKLLASPHCHISKAVLTWLRFVSVCAKTEC